MHRGTGSVFSLEFCFYCTKILRVPAKIIRKSIIHLFYSNVARNLSLFPPFLFSLILLNFLGVTNPVNALAGSLFGMGDCQPHSQRAQTSFLLGFFPPYGKKLGDLDFPASALRGKFLLILKTGKRILNLKKEDKFMIWSV